MNIPLINAITAGFVVGAMLNIPIGPNGALALYRSTVYGWTSLLPTAIGASVASVIYIFLGSVFVSNPIVSQFSQNIYVHIAGSILLALFAVILFKKSNDMKNINFSDLERPSNRSLFFTSFLGGITNPKSIVGFPAALVSFGYDFSGLDIFIASSCVALGGLISSVGWWIVFFGLSRRLSVGDDQVLGQKITRVLSYLVGLFALSRFFKAIL